MSFDIPLVEAPEKPNSRRSGIMLCYPFEEKRLATWEPPYIIQPKLDGVRCRAIVRKDNCILVSSENHIIEMVPHINKALSDSFSKISDEIELDGELYKHGMSFEDIFSITSRRKNKHANPEILEYHMFDVVGMTKQVSRIAYMLTNSNCLTDERLKIVQSYVVHDMQEIMRYFTIFTAAGYEGFILRNMNADYARKRSTNIMKFKPHQTDLYKIVGVQEEYSITGEPKGTLGAFICTSSEGTLFNVGTGLTQDQRVQYWQKREELIGKNLKVKYQALTQTNRVPRFPVALEVI